MRYSTNEPPGDFMVLEIGDDGWVKANFDQRRKGGPLMAGVWVNTKVLTLIGQD
jgi:hypothetical protein